MDKNQRIINKGKKAIDYKRQLTLFGRDKATTALQFWVLGYHAALEDSKPKRPKGVFYKGDVVTYQVQSMVTGEWMIKMGIVVGRLSKDILFINTGEVYKSMAHKDRLTLLSPKEFSPKELERKHRI